MKAPKLTFVAALVAGTLSMTPNNGQAVVVTVGCADSTFCSMDELLGGGTITIDDKLFTRFRDFSSTGDVQLQSTDIKVHSQSDFLGPLGVPGEIGLAFDIDEGSSNIVLLNAGETMSLGWLYDVEVLDPSRAIVDNTLLFPGGLFQGSFIANLVDSGEGLLTASETLTASPLQGPFVRKLISANDNGDPVQDHRDFAPISAFTVATQITGDGQGGSGVNVSLDILVQSFSQQVPEPSTLGLLGLAVLWLGLGRRKPAQPVRT